jgi:hypothetical protein
MMKQILLLAMLSSASLAQQDADTIIRRSVAANEADWKAAHEYDYVERDRQKGGATKTSEEIMILGSPYERLAMSDWRPSTGSRFPQNSRNANNKSSKQPWLNAGRNPDRPFRDERATKT